MSKNIFYFLYRLMSEGYGPHYNKENHTIVPSLQSSGGPSSSHHIDMGPSAIKRPRPDLTQPLHVDTEVKRVTFLIY